jgi:hypothetical protein
VRFLHRHRFALVFCALVVAGAVLFLREWRAREAQHLEAREAFILLHATGHAEPAQRLYERLVRELETQTARSLLEDFQRVSLLFDPAKPQPDNLVWRYHRSLQNELDKRAQSTLVRALQLAEREK